MDGTALIVPTTPLDDGLDIETIPPAATNPDKRRFSDRQIEYALRREGGVVSAAAGWLERTYGTKCSPSYLRKIVKSNQRWQDLIEDAHQDMIDQAKINLLNSLCETDAKPLSANQRWATEFTLKTLGKNQGFGYRVEHTGKDGSPLEIKIIGDDAKLL